MRASERFWRRAGLLSMSHLRGLLTRRWTNANKPLPGPTYHRAVAELALKDLVEGVRSIASIWTHLAWPATGLPRLFPLGTDKGVRTIYFIYGTVTGALVDDSLRAAADLQREGLSFDARSGVHPGQFEKIWHVLSVVDLIEESFLIRIHVHACYEEIFRVDGHLKQFA